MSNNICDVQKRLRECITELPDGTTVFDYMADVTRKLRADDLRRVLDRLESIKREGLLHNAEMERLEEQNSLLRARVEANERDCRIWHSTVLQASESAEIRRAALEDVVKERDKLREELESARRCIEGFRGLLAQKGSVIAEGLYITCADKLLSAYDQAKRFGGRQ